MREGEAFPANPGGLSRHRHLRQATPAGLGRDGDDRRPSRRFRPERIRGEGNSSLFLPFLLQDLQEMARAVDLVLIFTHSLSGAVCPAAWVGEFPVEQAPGLRFTLQL